MIETSEGQSLFMSYRTSAMDIYIYIYIYISTLEVWPLLWHSRRTMAILWRRRGHRGVRCIREEDWHACRSPRAYGICTLFNLERRLCVDS